jgi:hypothetical protein
MRPLLSPIASLFGVLILSVSACDGGSDDGDGRPRSAQPLTPLVLPASATATTLGDGLSRPPSSSPVGPLVDVDVDGSSICAIDAAFALWCWQVRTPSFASVFPRSALRMPVTLDEGDHFIDVEVERGVACGITTRGAVWCFGNTIGLPTATAALLPRRVVESGATRVFPASLANACWQGSDTTLWCLSDPAVGVSSYDVGGRLDEIVTSTLRICARGERGVACLNNGTFVWLPSSADVKTVVMGDSSLCLVSENGEVRCTPGTIEASDELVRTVAPVAFGSSSCVASSAGEVRCGLPYAETPPCAFSVDRLTAVGRFGCGHRADGTWVCFGGARGPAGPPIEGLQEASGFCGP